VQLFAAFYAQSFKKALPYLRRVFVARVVSWFLIGLSILLIGDKNPTLTLILFGIFLFIFSFSAGFGSIYFMEVMAKVFDKQQRGKTMANRQLFAAIGSIISGGIAGWVLSEFEPPKSYAYLFMISALLMSIGMIAFSTIKEPVKENVRIKVNFYPGTPTLVEHEPHTDYPFPHQGAVLALNTCNGFTRIKNRTIKSVANQMILFDPSKPHNSTTCTDQKGRWTINFNYF